MPKVKLGIIAKPSTRITTIAHAMTLVPNELVSACTTMAAMEKIACVRPEGRPSRMVRSVMCLSGMRLRARSVSVSRMWHSRQRHSTADAPCAMAVASATPSAVMPIFATNSRSSTMLSRHATIRKISGETESPRPRRMPETML